MSPSGIHPAFHIYKALVPAPIIQAPVTHPFGPCLPQQTTGLGLATSTYPPEPFHHTTLLATPLRVSCTVSSPLYMLQTPYNLDSLMVSFHVKLYPIHRYLFLNPHCCKIEDPYHRRSH